MVVIRTYVNSRGIAYPLCGPAAHKEDKYARDTLAHPAKGFALCTPISGGQSELLHQFRIRGEGLRPLHSYFRVLTKKSTYYTAIFS
jgi:hypothetical protein